MTGLRDAIDDAGGLYSRSGLARRWRVTKAYITEVTARPDFPAPVTKLDGRREVWTGHEADEWRNAPRSTGRPAR